MLWLQYKDNVFMLSQLFLFELSQQLGSISAESQPWPVVVLSRLMVQRLRWGFCLIMGVKRYYNGERTASSVGKC